MPATAAQNEYDAQTRVCAMKDAMTCETRDATGGAGVRRRAHENGCVQKTTMTSMMKMKPKCAGEPSRRTVDFVLDAPELVEGRRRFVGDAVHQIPGRGEHGRKNVGVDRNEPRVTRWLHPQFRGLG